MKAGLQQMQKNTEAAANLLKLMAHPSRLMVLCRLANEELSVGQLEKIVGLSQSALSQHLARLRDEQLIAAERRGQYIYYKIANKNVEKIIQTLDDIYCS